MGNGIDARLLMALALTYIRTVPELGTRPRTAAALMLALTVAKTMRSFMASRKQDA